MRVLFVDFPSASLHRELRKHNCETINVVTNGDGGRLGGHRLAHLVSRLSRDSDVLYYSKFVTHGFEDLAPYLSHLRCKSVLAFHTPVLIAHPDRAVYRLYNMANFVRLAMHKSLHVFDAFHSLNSFDHLVLSTMGLRTFMIPMGFDEDLYKPGEKSQDEFQVLFTGFLYHKGADIAARLAYALARRHKNMRFLLVNGTKETYLDNALHYRRFFAKLSAANITTLDYVEEEEFAQILGHSHLLLFPSKWESFGRVVVEALGSGCPITCFDVTGPPVALLRAYGVGHVAKPFDVSGLTNGILRFYNLWSKRFDQYMEVTRQCRRVSLVFSWKELAAKYLRLFEDVTGGSETVPAIRPTVDCLGTDKSDCEE